MDYEAKLLSIVELINNGQFGKSIDLCREYLLEFPNDCELNYLYGLSLDGLGMLEKAYYVYKLAAFLAASKEDRDIVLNSLNELSASANVSEYELGRAVRDIVTERLQLAEYQKTSEFLNQLLYDTNRIAAKIVLTEENMLLSMLLEIVLCEKNRAGYEIQKNTASKYHNDVYSFRDVYNKLKFIIRRIWFGCNSKAQQELVELVVKCNISSDMLAVVIKYSVTEDYLLDTFSRVVEILKSYNKASKKQGVEEAQGGEETQGAQEAQGGEKAQGAQEAQDIQGIVQDLLGYISWLGNNYKTSDRAANYEGKAVYVADNYDNGCEYIRLDYGKLSVEKRLGAQLDCENKKLPDGIGDENTFAIIFCTNDAEYERECLLYLKKLLVPDGMRLVAVAVWNAPGMAAGYNYAMKQVQAKYRLYIHHDTFIIKNDCLIKLAKAFDEDEELGLLGIFGSMDLQDSALWYKSEWENSRLNLYQDAILNILTSVSTHAKQEIEPAVAVDGVFIATSKDVSWREDIFDGWHYYDISCGYEYRKAGYKTGFISDKSGIWVMHETTMRKDPKDLYGKYRKIFIDNYMKTIVDILSPVGGKEGGVEEVIKSWVKNLDSTKYLVRVIHMTPGTAYLQGYPYAYSFKGPEKQDDYEYYVAKYVGFIAEKGAPNICVATNWPMMCVVANGARKAVGGSFKIFSWVHNRIEPYHEAGLGGVAHLTYADAHLVLNSHNERLILAQDPKALVYVVGNPVNIPELIEVEKKPFELAFVGRLADVKRLDVVLEAIYRAKDLWSLKVIGTGEMLDEWKQIVDFLKLDNRIQFLGWHSSPWELVRESVALVAASDYEGFMLTGVEALAVGTQVISTPVDGVVDYVIPGKNGYLFGFENAIELAQILDLLGKNALPVCDSATCRESVLKYETGRYFDRIDEIFEKELNNKN